MDIRSISNNNFKGYDARPLQGFIMSRNSAGIAEEMLKIGKKEGFKIFAPKNGNLKQELPYYQINTSGGWAQDLWTIVKNKILAYDYDIDTNAIKNFFNLTLDFTQKIAKSDPIIRHFQEDYYNISDMLGGKQAMSNPLAMMLAIGKRKERLAEYLHKTHISGGNIFLIKGRKKDEAIVGENELNKFDIDEIKAMYCTNKLTVLPQMDYHLDLFIRPLDNKRILIADDNMTIAALKKALDKLQNKICEVEDNEKYKDAYTKTLKVLNLFKQSKNENPYVQTDDVEKILQNNGYKVIRIPGRLYRICRDDIALDKKLILHDCNYINANVLKNEQGEIVYITNKSNIDETMGLTPEISKEIGFSFESNFISSISKYIKPEHIYFIKGENDFVAKIMLPQYMGGIHCTACEVPIK